MLESRILRFWFKDEFPVGDRAKYAQEFFKELVSPLEFPRGKIIRMVHIFEEVVKMKKYI